MRTFLALPLEDTARTGAERCLEALRRNDGARALRLVRPEGLHVTLRFLGETPPEALPRLRDGVAAEVAACAPFTVRLDGLHVFPSPRRPRVLALGLFPPAPLEALAAAVERGVVAAALPPDRGVVAAALPPERRRFRPHVTLARVREGRGPRAAPAGRGTPPAPEGLPAPEGAFVAREVVLFESRLGPGGSRYSPLERLPLGVPGSR